MTSGLKGTLTDKEWNKFKEASDGTPAVQTYSINQLVPEQFDSISLIYSGSTLTSLTYSLNGTTVATLTLGWTGDNLTSVTKT
jgi:hypothetical protein